MQTRVHSILESLTHISVGFAAAIPTNYYVLPLFGFDNISVSDSVAISVVFGVFALVRGYCIRRLFNLWTIRRYKRSGGYL